MRDLVIETGLTGFLMLADLCCGVRDGTQKLGSLGFSDLSDVLAAFELIPNGKY